MGIKLHRYPDGSYVPLSNPLSRRYDMGDINKKSVPDPTKDPKSPRYKKNWIDKTVDRIFSR